MEVYFFDKNKRRVAAQISEGHPSELKNLTKWKFNWSELDQYKDSRIYKLQSDQTEGLLMIQFIDEEFFEMKNIEVAPSNYGSKGVYINAAELLIAYACLLAFEYNKGPYLGYLSFISKGNLIDYYIEKYGAELVFRERMQINPINGMKLIKKHLNIEL